MWLLLEILLFVYLSLVALYPVFNTHPINRISKAGAAIVNTISSLSLVALYPYAETWVFRKSLNAW